MFNRINTITIVGSQALNELFLKAGLWHKLEAEVGFDTYLYSMLEEDLDALDKAYVAFDGDNHSWWYRYSAGSNMASHELKTFIIKGQPILAWNSTLEPEYDDDGTIIPNDTEFRSIYHYLEDVLGATMWSNIIALTKDLARINNLTVTELFLKYSGAVQMGVY